MEYRKKLDMYTGSLEYIQYDTIKGGSRAGLWGGYLIHFIVLSCGKFLKAIAYYREYYCLRNNGPVAPGVFFKRQTKEICDT